MRFAGARKDLESKSNIFSMMETGRLPPAQIKDTTTGIQMSREGFSIENGVSGRGERGRWCPKG